VGRAHKTKAPARKAGANVSIILGHFQKCLTLFLVAYMQSGGFPSPAFYIQNTNMVPTELWFFNDFLETFADGRTTTKKVSKRTSPR